MGLVELVAAVFSGSVALFAAGIDALSDTVTSVVVLAGLHISKRPADRGHPYGHAQAETLASLILAIVLFFAGLRVAFLAAEKFQSGATPVVSFELLMVTIAAIVVSGLLARYKITTGRETHSMAVTADGYHTLTDAVSAVAVLGGLVFVIIGHLWADSFVALGISALIVYWSLGIGRNALNVLMGASPGEDTMNKISSTCLEVPGVLGSHGYRARRVGSQIHADVHITVNPKITVEKSHDIATKVERRLKSKIPDLESVVVHIEPARRDKVGKKR